MLLDDRKCRSASPTGPSRTQNKPDGETVRRVVRPLAALRERPNGGDPPADQRQVERRDRHATDDTPGGLASVRQSGAHDRRPADRDREMNGHRGGQQHRCTLLMWEQHRAAGAAPFQDVLPSDQRPRRGGDRRTRRSSQPGCQGSHGSPARRRLTRPSCQAPDDFSKRQSALSPDRQAAGRRVARPSAARSRAAHKGGRTMSPSGRSQAARASRRLPKEGRRHSRRSSPQAGSSNGASASAGSSSGSATRPRRSRNRRARRRGRTSRRRRNRRSAGLLANGDVMAGGASPRPLHGRSRAMRAA